MNKLKKTLIFGILVILILGISFVISADSYSKNYGKEKKQIKIYGGEVAWKLMSATGEEQNLTLWILNESDKKTELGFIIKEGKTYNNLQDKELYDENGSLILDDKNKSISLKYETAKCGGQDCYHISLTDAQAVNIEEYIKLRNESIVIEYTNELAEYNLLNNSCDKNYRFCQAIIKTNLKENTTLLDDINFLYNKVRRYQIYLNTTGEQINQSYFNSTSNQTEYFLTDAPDWTLYENQNVSGEKIWKIEGEKRPSWMVDWVVDKFGVSLTEWAIWGNISLGDQAEITLNSPSNGSIQTISPQIFNCSANVTGGATLMNISLWGNFNGTWLNNQTKTGNTEINITYDDFGDGSINTSLWATSIGGDGQVTESGGKLNVQTDATGGEDSASFTSKNLPVNLSKVTYIYLTYSINAYDSFSGTGDASISLFGYTRNVHCASDSCNHIESGSLEAIRNGTDYDIYRNGAFVTTYTPANTNISISGTSSNTGHSLSYLDILKWSGESPYTSSKTETFSKIISQDTSWACSAGDSDGVTGFSTTNWTILLNSAPQIIINSPLSTSTNTNVTMNFNFTDDLGLMDYCFYNVTTSGLGVIVADNSINCSNALEYQTISVGTGYILNIFGNDTIGNSNISSISFDITNPVTPSGGGGGGGGGTVIIGGTAGWTFETTSGSSSYNKNLPAGTSVRLSLNFENIGDESREITLKCVDVTGSMCQYVEFEEKTFSLPLIKDVKTVKYFIITLPDEFGKGDYQFNILATDDLSKGGTVTVKIASGTQSVPLEIISKLSLGSKLLGGFPYFAIFGIVLVFTLVVSRRIFSKDGLGTMWGIISAFFLSTIAVYFL